MSSSEYLQISDVFTHTQIDTWNSYQNIFYSGLLFHLSGRRKNRWMWWTCRQTGETPGGKHLPKTRCCVMSSPLKPTTHHISSYRRHRKSEVITVHLSDVTTVHLVRWATTLWHCYINGGVKKKKNQSNSWILEFVFGRNRIIKANKMSSGYLCH